MERNSIIIKKHGIRHFLSNIKFAKPSFELYKKIVLETSIIDDYSLIFIVLQASSQVGFDGYFDELYLDVCKRREIYIKQIKQNFKVSFSTNQTCMAKLTKLFCCIKMSNKEILFNRFYLLLDLDTIIAKFFVENNETNKNNFINICNQMLSENQSAITKNKVVPVTDF